MSQPFVSDGRAQSIARFFYHYTNQPAKTMTPLAGDASTRRYWRVHDQDISYIVMDDQAHPETAQRFAQLASDFAERGAPVPKVYAQDSAQGLLLLEDFGDDWIAHALNSEPENTMPRLLALLHDWQSQQQDLCPQLPAYNEALLVKELTLFDTWFVPFIFDTPLDAAQHKQLSEEYQALAQAIARHDSVCVHRDFHCRNIMNRGDNQLGLLDFQDAVTGSVCYDLISLTRDCYIRYPQADVQAWESAFRTHAPTTMDEEAWRMACEQTALQRHVKVLGIFVRLAVRDGKQGYLKDLERVLDYACAEVAFFQADHPVLASLLNEAQQRLPERLRVAEDAAAS
ncbi:phosphotransferase [Suttonella sp. R2A3]|uniref:aminoglycoside phosphotransferase family protein n=1 Tax=Suttonella sp. R2A3 TaxID=2908648 RepID=UPI001F2B8C8C|nr:phosphotransferase [Suttonella sp. R2A3]UJF23884.1 phosphotransferase [Suttonella sp. R2A3]